MWRTVAIALELLQYSTQREAEKQFPKEAVRRAGRAGRGTPPLFVQRMAAATAAPQCTSRVQGPR